MVRVGRLHDASRRFNTDNDFHFLMGGGLEYFFTNVGVRAEVISFDTDAHYAGLGLRYRFASSEEKSRNDNNLKKSGISANSSANDAISSMQRVPNTEIDTLMVQPLIVYFDTDQHELTPQHRQYLAEQLRRFRDRGDYTLDIVGYTDITGPEIYNLWLGEKRARAVRSFFIDNAVSSDQITFGGSGETQQFGVGPSRESLRKNRKAIITIK